MDIPLHEYPVCIDFHPFVEELEKKYGFKMHDMAGLYSAEGRAERNLQRDKWLIENGYAGKAYVLNAPEGSVHDWAKDSEEMLLRIEINTKIRDVEEKWDRPYQNVWHWLISKPFEDLNRGGVNYLSKDWLDSPYEKTPDYVLTFLKAVFDEIPEDHPAFDGESVKFHVDW
jgi:hypothetical protein